MKRRSPSPRARPQATVFGQAADELLPEAVYRDLLAPLFAMAIPILGFGILYAVVGTLVLVSWHSGPVLALVLCSSMVTAVRLAIIRAYHRAGGLAQDIPALRRWENRYTWATCACAGLIASLNLVALAAPDPLVHLATVSLIFTFGAGIVSRNAGRPKLCLLGQTITVVPVSLGMLVHATRIGALTVTGQFFILEAILLLVVAAMSIESVRHLYHSALEHLTTKHDLGNLARYDPLTGLANRLLVRESFFKQALSCRIDQQIAIHYLDLDGFKAINDQFGHPVGDRLLIQVAARLGAAVRGDDVIGRLGGDEFVVLQPGVLHADQAELLARRIIRQLSESYRIDDTEMQISASVGISLAPVHGLDLDRLLQCADAALYRSKRKGKAQVHFCEDPAPSSRGRAVA
ncbi:GGDEF domain-containing protein [Novosphingobium kaempferiae]|uniref:GGDEF domain-containing protein n=1 Tax=Novosphingobium kaempferiae TaxID=2896849 RepID=UPI001E35AE76|nr:GGDEF domain-containing protein [Novosphingobium kaempferiae]